jgi:hypothetical protein
MENPDKDYITKIATHWGYNQYHQSWAPIGLQYAALISSTCKVQVSLLALSNALKYLETASKVYDLADDEQAFLVYAYLTETLQMPDAYLLIELVLSSNLMKDYQ